MSTNNNSIILYTQDMRVFVSIFVGPVAMGVVGSPVVKKCVRCRPEI